MTKGALAKELAKKFKISLSEMPTPTRISGVKRQSCSIRYCRSGWFFASYEGTKGFSGERRVPCFRLSLLGTVVAASLDEIET
jgi:hypothetical protein